MKRLLSNKSGFSLAEIIIAIAVFSIMMAMIMQMLQLSIAQRNENYRYMQSLNKQQNDLVVNGKDTTIADGTTFDGTVSLSFKKDPNDAGETPLDIDMDYVVRTADPDASDVNEGLNYFIGNYDYDADGVGGGGGTDGDGNGLGQSSKYDTRITGTKGLKNINISVSKNPSLPSGVTLSAGQVAYEITVSADSSDMLADDKPDSQIRLYFKSTTSYHSSQVDITKKVEKDGMEVEEVVDTYYKKVYDEAKIAKVIQTAPNMPVNAWDPPPAYTASQISGNSVKIGVTNGYNADGFKPGTPIKFIVIFNGDPQITASSFGKGSGGTYNQSSVYEIQKNDAGKYETVTKIGKTHANIYGSYPFEVSDKPFT
ncbi:MAG: prepilin-type N-terminal cleavage/methylation domain-containing protein [Ruminococcaceae bacterium]|nr:prepilin-type N-terminal cleavage/methylation domain-containing protein [Oscillospiraceae bacterium]